MGNPPPARKTRRAVSAETKAEIIRLYQKSGSVANVARQTGRAYGTVMSLLTRAGVHEVKKRDPDSPDEARKRDDPDPPLRSLLSEDVDVDPDEVVRRYVEDGLSTWQVAREFGVTQQSVYRLLKKRKVTRTIRQGVNLRFTGRGSPEGLAEDLGLDADRVVELLKKHGFVVFRAGGPASAENPPR